jgi:hypothetical protein
MIPFNITCLNSHTLHFHSVQILSSVPLSDTLRTEFSFRAFKTVNFTAEFEVKDLTLRNHRVKREGKAIPLQAWTGPEGSRRVRLPDSKTIGT